MYGSASSLADGLGGRGEPELEPPEDQGQRAHGLQRGELVAHALAAAAPKGQEGEVGRDLPRVQPRHPIRVVALPAFDARVRERPLPPGGIEPLRVLPVGRAAVQVPGRDEHVRALQQPGLPGGAPPGQRVRLQGAADEQRRLRVQPQGLDQRHAHQPEVLQVADGGVPAAGQHRVHFAADRRQRLRLLGEVEEAPGQHGRGGFVARDQHRHQVVPQLLARGVLPPHVHQEAQQRGVLAHLALLQLLHVALHRGLVGQHDQLVQDVVQDLHVLLELHLAGQHVLDEGDFPVGDEAGAAVLGLLERGVHALDHGALLGHAVELVVEDRAANDVQRDRAEHGLHVQRLLAGGGPVERAAHLQVALHKELGHGVQPPRVEARHDGLAPHLPGGRVRGDQPLAHHLLQDVGQDALVVAEGVLAQDVLGHHRVRDHDKGPRPKGQLEHRAVLLVVFLH
mmetsp:Transcript_7147/g.11222  ORF Transcript_7147/g.11222 Transcript_7147/m.11222 type:complete len:453 (-) Transcript_7147:652-2010(-)